MHVPALRVSPERSPISLMLTVTKRPPIVTLSREETGPHQVVVRLGARLPDFLPPD
jgi:hypothetical protein